MSLGNAEAAKKATAPGEHTAKKQCGEARRGKVESLRGAK